MQIFRKKKSNISKSRSEYVFPSESQPSSKKSPEGKNESNEPTTELRKDKKGIVPTLRRKVRQSTREKPLVLPEFSAPTLISSSNELFNDLPAVNNTNSCPQPYGTYSAKSLLKLKDLGSFSSTTQSMTLSPRYRSMTSNGTSPKKPLPKPLPKPKVVMVEDCDDLDKLIDEYESEKLQTTSTKNNNTTTSRSKLEDSNEIPDFIKDLKVEFNVNSPRLEDDGNFTTNTTVNTNHLNIIDDSNNYDHLMPVMNLSNITETNTNTVIPMNIPTTSNEVDNGMIDSLSEIDSILNQISSLSDNSLSTAKPVSSGSSTSSNEDLSSGNNGIVKTASKEKIRRRKKKERPERKSIRNTTRFHDIDNMLLEIGADNFDIQDQNLMKIINSNDSNDIDIDSLLTF